MQNPLNGIVPNFTVFGAHFTAIWQKLGAGLWAVAILAAVAALAQGLVGMAHSRGGHPGALRESRHEAVIAGWSLGGLVALGAIVGAIIAVFSG